MILSRYFFKLSFKTFIVSIASLVALIQLADLFTVLWPKIDEGLLPTQLWQASLLNLPTSITQSITFALLFSGAYSLGSFAATGELLAAQSCGVSVARLVRSFIIMALFCSLLQTIVASPISNLDSKRAGLLVNKSLQSKEAFSYRWDKGLFYSERYSPFEKVFYDILIVETDEVGNLTRRINALTATWVEPSWQLSDARIFYPNRAAQYYQHYKYTAPLNPSVIDRAEAPPDELPLKELKAYIAYLKKNNLSSYSEQMTYYRHFSGPWQTLLVSFFPLLIIQTRKNGLLNSLLQSIILAVIFFVIQMIFNILGESNRIAAPLAAFMPLFLMALGMAGFKIMHPVWKKLLLTLNM